MTLITVLVSMLSLSFYLTAFAILYVCLMLVISRKIAARSGKYFVRQQKSIGDLNGYVEEMINGQRVVKVFCHEEAAKRTSTGATRNSATTPPAPTATATCSCR